MDAPKYPQNNILIANWLVNHTVCDATGADHAFFSDKNMS